MIIPISGSCCSGKTTFIKKVKDIYGDDSLICDEIIRNKKIKNIDSIREDNQKYFELEKKIITQKIYQEREAKKINKKITLFDRSLIDSFYYYTKYVDKNTEGYQDFLIFLINKIHESFREIYDYIFLFKPLKNNGLDDKYRPNNLRKIQDQEYKEIKNLTFEVCSNKNKIKIFNIKEDEENALNFIKGKKDEY